MPGPVFELEPGFHRALLSSPEVLLLIGELTEATVHTAKALAPDDPSTPEHSIADGIVAEVGIFDGKAAGRAVAQDFKSHWHEFGTVKMHAHPFLRPAAEIEVGPLEAGEEATDAG